MADETWKVLKPTREHANLSQEDMAEVLFMSRSSISKIENGITILSATTLIEWLVKVKRMDIFGLLIKGMEVDEILKYAFTIDYYNKLKESNFKHPTIEQVSNNLGIYLRNPPTI